MRILLTICTSFALLGAVASAQTTVSAKPITDSDIQLLRSDVQADKNAIIAHTMQFSDAESTAFWPVYRDYARDQQLIGDQRVQLIKDYAQNYDSLDDAKAKDLMQRAIGIDEKTLALRRTIGRGSPKLWERNGRQNFTRWTTGSPCCSTYN